MASAGNKRIIGNANDMIKSVHTAERKREKEQEEDVNIIELNAALTQVNAEHYKSLIAHQIYINKCWRLRTNHLHSRPHKQASS